MTDASRDRRADDPRIVQMQQQIAALQRQVATMADRLLLGDEVMRAMREELAANTSVTSEIRDVIAAGRVGLQVLGGIGTFIRWLGGIGVAIGGLYALFYAATHGGKPPHS